MRTALLQGRPRHSWLDRFDRDPEDSLADLLVARVDLGRLAPLDPGAVLVNWLDLLGETSLRGGSDDGNFRSRIDAALRTWIAASWGTRGLARARGHRALTSEAWTTASRVIRQDRRLSASAAELGRRLLGDPAFLDGLRLGPADDPFVEAHSAVSRYARSVDVDLPWSEFRKLWLELASLMAQPSPRGFTGFEALLELPLSGGNQQIPPICFRGLEALGIALHDRTQANLVDPSWAKGEVERACGSLLARFPSEAHRGEYAIWRRRTLAGQEPPFPRSWTLAVAESGPVSRPRPVAVPARVPDEEFERWAASDPEVAPLFAAAIKERERFAERTGDYAPFAAIVSLLAKRVPRAFAPELQGWIERAFRWAPHDPFLWSARVHVYQVEGRGAEALEMAVAAARRFPDVVALQTDLAKMLKEAGRIAEALSIYLEVTSRFPENPYGWSGLAESYREIDRPDEALATYRQALANPLLAEDPYLLVGHGYTLLGNDERGDAERQFRAALKIAPTNSRAREGLDRAVASGSRRKEASPSSAVRAAGQEISNDPWILRRYLDWSDKSLTGEGLIEARSRVAAIVTTLGEVADPESLTAIMSLRLALGGDEGVVEARRLLELARDRFPDAMTVSYFEQRISAVSEGELESAGAVGAGRLDPVDLARRDPLMRPVALRLVMDGERFDADQREQARDDLRDLAARQAGESGYRSEDVRLYNWYLRTVVRADTIFERERLEEDFVDARSLLACR